MTREEKLQKAHQMFDNRNLLTELKWQRNYFNRGYVSKQEELFNLWIFDECINALEQEPRKGHWDIKDNMWWVCSACGCQTRMMKKYNVPNFCPACGADMRGEK